MNKNTPGKKERMGKLIRKVLKITACGNAIQRVSQEDKINEFVEINGE